MASSMTGNNKKGSTSNKLFMNLLQSARVNSSLESSKENVVEAAQQKSSLYDKNELAAPPLKKIKVEKLRTMGKGWFEMEPMKMDETLKRDIKVIQMRNYLDPRRFYKNPDKLGTVLHVGTVVEGVGEFKSARMTNKERKQTIVEEIMSDSRLKNYSKRKYSEIQALKSNKRRIRGPLRKNKK